MNKKKVLLALISLTVLVLFLTAAGGSQRTGSGAADTGTTGAGFIQYPIRTDVVLTHWFGLPGNINVNYTNLADTPFGRTREEKTGVKVQYIHPAAGMEQEQFNLIIASRDLPDILTYNWLHLYMGGLEKAYDDGIILQLNDIYHRWGPNFRAYLDANPAYDRMVKSDSGNYYAFYHIRGDDGLLITNGPMMRKDWLDELGLAIPETFDDWHTILTAFRDRKGATAPFTWVVWDRIPFFLSYGLWARGPTGGVGFVLDDNGNVVFSPIHDDYRKVLTMMAQWYSEGLIDPDFASLNTNQYNQKMITGAAGATGHQLGGGMGNWTAAARQTNPSYELVGVPYPVERRGERAKSAHSSFNYTGVASAAITTNAENVEIAARYLDWNYSEEGHILNNFGIEGVSFNWVNGYPRFSDLIFNHPQGWSVAQAISAHALGPNAGPYIQDMRMQEQNYGLPEQAAAVSLWAFPGMQRYMVPPITPTPEENTEFAQIMQSISTHVEEMDTRFILGLEALTDANWNNYVNRIRQMGIARAIEIQSSALVRYNNR